MAEILPDELWQGIKQELPESKPSPKGGVCEPRMRGLVFPFHTRQHQLEARRAQVVLLEQKILERQR